MLNYEYPAVGGGAGVATASLAGRDEVNGLLVPADDAAAVADAASALQP